MKKKKKNLNNDMDIKGFIILTSILVAIVILIYLLTLGAQKLGWFDLRYVKPDVEKAQISYDEIIGGMVFNRPENEYYVIIGDFSDKSTTYLGRLADIYRNKEDHLPIYKVDLSMGFNKGFVSEEDNYSAQSPNELRVHEHTLIKISNGRNVVYVTGDESIQNELGL